MAGISTCSNRIKIRLVVVRKNKLRKGIIDILNDFSLR